MIDNIPSFLIIPPAERSVAWSEWLKTHRYKKQGSAFRPLPTPQEEAATRALRKELERQEAAKKADRIAALRERFGR